MPPDTHEEPKQDTNNPGDRHWDDEFNAITGTKDLQDLEKKVDGEQYSKPSSELSEKDLGTAARNGEQTNGAWADNTSKQASKSSTKQNAWGKTKAFFKNKTATVAIVALLGGGAAVPFFGTASLPFAILGNMDSSSMLLGLGKYKEDYTGFRFFGSNKASVQNGTGGKLAGLREPEIEQLRANGVEFRGEKTNRITKKTTFTAVKLKDGDWITAGNKFKREMKNNAAFRKAMIFNKSSYWKSAKSAAAANARARMGFNPNPDLTGKDEAERNKKLAQEASGTTNTDVSGRVNAGDDVSDDVVESADGKVGEIAAGLEEEIDAAKELVAEGEAPESVAANSNKGNIGLQFERTSLDPVDGVRGVGSQIFSYVNSLGAIDTICTAYQTAHTAAVITRTVMLANITRFAMAIRASLERSKAGNDTGELNYLMKMLSNRDPVTNQSFDTSSYASLLFTGKLSSEPSAVSAFGGQSMILLNLGLHALHEFVGGGNAGTGRSALKTTCGVATNLGVQIVATVGSVAVGILSGGSTAVGGVALNVAVRTGLEKARTVIVKEMVQKFGKEMIEKIRNDVAQQGAVRYLSRTAWATVRTGWKTMDVWDKLGLLVAGVGTFGMGYIVDALSGSDVIGYTANGVAAFDAIGTGWNNYEFINGLAAGGTVATYAQAAAYQPTQQQYSAQYIADMKYNAKDIPLDISNPYSTLGAAMFGAQKMVGLSASMDIFSTLRSVATLPLKLPGMRVSAEDGAPTPQAIGEQIGDPFMSENQIALTVTGSPVVIFDKTLTFEEFLEKFVDNETPQVTYDGDDETTGDPKFSIIPGGQLASYAELCHNPNRTELDLQFADDTSSNMYDITDCIKNKNAAFDDAIRFIHQVGPDVTSSTSGSTDTTGAIVDVGQNASGAQTPWGGYKNGEIPESAMTKIPLADACSTGYGANSPLRAYLHPKATISVIELNSRYKAKFGRDMYFKGCYRTLSEQQRAWNNEPPGNAARPGTSNHGWGLAIDFAISASQSMTYGSEEYKWLMDNAYKVGWVNPPSMRAGASGPDEPWHWEYAGSTQTVSSL